MKQEFEISEEWLGYELHPETPPAGVPLKKLFPGLDEKKMLAGLLKAGAPYGVGFERIEFLANSRLALEAGEFARDAGKFEDAHTRLFRAYFQEGQNIGDKQTLLKLLKEIGLDDKKLTEALENNVYNPRLAQARKRGKEYAVTGLPTFIVNAREKIVGAQPFQVFQEALKKFA